MGGSQNGGLQISLRITNFELCPKANQNNFSKSKVDTQISWTVERK